MGTVSAPASTPTRVAITASADLRRRLDGRGARTGRTRRARVDPSNPGTAVTPAREEPAELREEPRAGSPPSRETGTALPLTLFCRLAGGMGGRRVTILPVRLLVA